MKKFSMTSTRTEKEFWKIINTPINYTDEELNKLNQAPTYEEIQESIKEKGIGFVTYAENHRGKEDELAKFIADDITLEEPLTYSRKD